MSKSAFRPLMLIFLIVLQFASKVYTPAYAQYQPPEPPIDIVVIVTQISLSFTEPKNVVTIIVTDFDKDQVVKELTIHLKEPMSYLMFTIYLLSDKPPEIPVPSELVMIYFIIRAREDLLMNIEKATIIFRVKDELIEDMGVDEDNLFLNRYTQNIWNKYNAMKIGREDQFSLFQVETPGLSHFAITGVRERVVFSPSIVAIIVPISLIAIIFVRYYLSKRRSELRGSN